MTRGLLLVWVVASAFVFASQSPVGAQDGNGPESRTFLVRTSPSVPGFEVAIEGVGTAVTDETGTASFELDTLDDIRTRISAVTSEIMVDESTRFRFNAFQRFNGEGVTAAFNVDYLSEFAFTDRDGNAVDTDRIQEMALRSSIGEVLSVTGPRALWLHGTRVLSNNVPRAIYWTVQSVTIDGTSVVNRSEYRITPSEQSHLDIELLMFDLQVVVQSRLLGSNAGNEIVLEHPDGATSRHDLEAGRATIRSLPRGEYSITTSGFGIGISRPVALSRDQEVRLHFFPWLEVAAAAAVIMALLILPVRLGARRRASRSEPTTEAAATQSPPEVGARNP